MFPPAFQHNLVLAPIVRLSVIPSPNLLRDCPISAINSSVIAKMYCCGFNWQPPTPLPCAKCGLNGNDELCVCCACGHQRMRRLHAWMVCKHSFARLGTDGSGMCQFVSRVRSISVCAVSRSVIHGVLHSKTIPQPTRLVSHVLQQTSCSKNYRVATCRLCADIRFRSRPLPCAPHTTWEQTIIKHVHLARTVKVDPSGDSFSHSK